MCELFSVIIPVSFFVVFVQFKMSNKASEKDNNSKNNVTEQYENDYLELMESLAQSVKFKAEDQHRIKLECSRTTAFSIPITANKTLKFIITKTPDKLFIPYFMGLLRSEDVGTIVMLEDFNEKNDYLPQRNNQNSDIDASRTEAFTIRKLTLKVRDNTEPQRIMHFLYNNWSSNPDTPNDMKSFIGLIKEVKKYHIDLDKRIFVHCSSGSGRSSLFISLFAFMEQLQENVTLDLRFIREYLFLFPKNVQQYAFLMEAVKELDESDDALEEEFFANE